MKRMTVAVCAAALLLGLATRTVAVADESAAPVKVFEAGELTLGGYTVVNLHCLNNQRAWFSGGNAYFCYGLAIKLK